MLEVDGPPESMAGWMKGLGSIENPPAKVETNDGAKPNKPEGDAAPVGDGKAGTGAADANAPGADTAAAKQAAAAAKAEEDRKAAEAKAATAKEAEARKQAEAAKAAPVEEKWPRTSADWDKFKENRKQEREKLEREIKTRDETIGSLQAKVKETEEAISKGAGNGEFPAEAKKQIETLQARANQLSQRLQELEVTAHPDFQSYFKFKIDEQVSIAKDMLGEEKGKKFEEIVNIPEHPSLREYKKAAMDDLLSDLSPYEAGSLSSVTTNLRMIERERQSEISKAKTHADELKAKADTEKKQTATQTAAQREKLFNDAITTLKDDKVGSAVYQKRDGDEAWNKAVEQRILNAKRYLFGAPDLKPEEISLAALHAAAFPGILAAYKEDMVSWRERAEKAEGQVKALTAAQPGNRNGGAGGGGGGEGEALELRDDMNPFEASRAFAKKMIDAQRGD